MVDYINDLYKQFTEASEITIFANICALAYKESPDLPNKFFNLKNENISIYNAPTARSQLTSSPNINTDELKSIITKVISDEMKLYRGTMPGTFKINFVERKEAAITDISVSNKRVAVWMNTYGNTIVATCGVCNNAQIFVTSSSWHIGHIDPKSKGGSSELDNLRAICADCNYKMSNTHMSDYVDNMQFKPPEIINNTRTQFIPVKHHKQTPFTPTYTSPPRR